MTKIQPTKIDQRKTGRLLATDFVSCQKTVRHAGKTAYLSQESCNVTVQWLMRKRNCTEHMKKARNLTNFMKKNAAPYDPAKVICQNREVKRENEVAILYHIRADKKSD